MKVTALTRALLEARKTDRNETKRLLATARPAPQSNVSRATPADPKGHSVI